MTIGLAMLAKDKASSIDVAPRSSTKDSPDRWYGYAKAMSQRCRSSSPLGVETANQEDFIFVEHCSTIRRTGMSLASLVCRVGHVLRVRAEEQMCRIDARRVIAAVKNMQTIRDWAYCEFVGDPMRTRRPIATASEMAIAVRKTRTSPRPALIIGTLCNMVPESLFEAQARRSVNGSGSLPAHVMHSAIATSEMWPTATFYFADHYTTV